MKTKDTSETPQASVRPALHRPAVLRLALTLCALGASSDPLRFALLPSINCAPVPTAWARGGREGRSLSLRARSLSVAFRASDVVVHVQGAQAVSPEQPLVIPGSPFNLFRPSSANSGCGRPSIVRSGTARFSGGASHRQSVFVPMPFVFSFTLLTTCDIFLVPPSGKEERQRIRRNFCRVYKDFFRRVRSRDKSKQLLKFCQELHWHRDTSILHRSETNGLAERAVRRVKEENCSRCCPMRPTQLLERLCDGMLQLVATCDRRDGRCPNNIRKKRFWKTIHGPFIPFGASVELSVWKHMLKEISYGCVLRVLGKLVR